MSKIGKRAILLLLALPIGFNVMAQETKKPTLEELIPGGESYLYAENLYGLQWWGDECIKPGIDTIAARTGFLHNDNFHRPESGLPVSVSWFLVP